MENSIGEPKVTEPHFRLLADTPCIILFIYLLITSRYAYYAYQYGRDITAHVAKCLQACQRPLLVGQ